MEQVEINFINFLFSLLVSIVISIITIFSHRPTLACLRTVTCGYALTMTFVPGDRHLIVGMKDGKMLIVDIASGEILEEIPAHSKEVWSVTLFPDMVRKIED